VANPSPTGQCTLVVVVVRIDAVYRIHPDWIAAFVRNVLFYHSCQQTCLRV